MSWNSGDNGANYAPSGGQSSSIIFKQGTTTIASVTINASISSGNITLSQASASGSPGVNFYSNGGASPYAVITKSGAETRVTAYAINLGDLGKG